MSRWHFLDCTPEGDRPIFAANTAISKEQALSAAKTGTAPCRGGGVRLGIFCGLLACLAAIQSPASEVVLKDGRVLKGRLTESFGLAESNNGAIVDDNRTKSILIIIDDLRRTYVPKRQLMEVHPDTAAPNEEKFMVHQPAPKGNTHVASIGQAAKVTPFDEFGRRNLTMNTPRGPLTITQAITEITPQWIKVEGLNFLWDMRIATGTMPRDTLHKILLHQIDPQNIEQRKSIARLYLQSERYQDARQELQAIENDFAAKTDIRQQLEPTIRELRQLEAQQMLKELKLRRASGQHARVQALLKKFPAEDVAGETLQAAREIIEDYDAQEARRVKLLKDYQSLGGKVKDPAMRDAADKVRAALAEEMNIDTLARLAAFQQNAGDDQMTPEDRLALSISGWVLGADNATPQLPSALSAYKLSELVRRYLSEPVKLHRMRVFLTLSAEKDATPAVLTEILDHMKPPMELPELVDEKIPDYYRVEVTTMPKEPPLPYYVQLPPEYNPYRRYPTILTLHGLGSTPEMQIDWWAGPASERGRLGQATRFGYIVVAPLWTVEHQKEYGYSAREHAAVLGAFRDACRRFAIDTDHVYLSGHSAGGDAAWDLGLAHPDLWAGVIPIAGESQRFCSLYWENAKNLPFYIIEGELDGGRLARCGRDLDRYYRHGFNTTVVEYLGRGHENFSDEQLRLFDWMARFRRNFFPREFSCSTMRPWDNYFWWAEADGLLPASMVNPADWPPPRNTRAATIEGYNRANNSLVLKSASSRVTLWLSPQMIDFTARVSISVNGHQVTSQGPFVRPSVETLLEDARTRADRQHPFWAKVDVFSGRQ
jgi:pimeloyl-ACP methyl ester carboxylesterase